MNNYAQQYRFQFLIGRLKTKNSMDFLTQIYKFQFLIGRLKTREYGIV